MDLLLKARKIKASLGKDNGRKKNTHPQNITKIALSFLQPLLLKKMHNFTKSCAFLLTVWDK